GQLGRGYGAGAIEPVAQEAHWMLLEREAGGGVVLRDLPEGGHPRKPRKPRKRVKGGRRGGAWPRVRLEQRRGRVAQLQDLPQRVLAIQLHRAEGVGLRQPAQGGDAHTTRPPQRLEVAEWA